ncbi:FtsX-like permease family protein [Streptomyces sp. KR80]|uniref:FtsX-like permease family protein n=1 Tax=Streptomyces sp. KR80 TaxID=3457426 RepID=UPI003FD0DFEB
MSGPVMTEEVTSTAPSGGGAADGRTSLTRWVSDLALGVRFAAAGGRQGWVRTLLTALGVGLGVALLLVASAVPTMLGNREARGLARDDSYFGAEIAPGDDTLVVGQGNTEFRGKDIRGSIYNPDGSNPPVPPGIEKIPGPGEMVVSPALKDLLTSKEGTLLRDRLDDRIVGTIADEGLSGPSELAYYAGSDKLTVETGSAFRIKEIGSDAASEGLGAILTLLVVIVFVVLLMPVAVFIGTAVRFGGERRDRRLAALRLVGADSAMTRRIAAGEALFGSLIGMVFGLGFFLIGRQLIGSITLMDISVFPSDVSPSPALAALIVIAVPAAAIGVTIVAMRGITVEPLGVVRNAGAGRRRLWWRLLFPAAGLVLLLPLMGQIASDEASINEYQIVGGTVLLLVGVTAVLPWLVERVVGLFGGAGPVSWQLATRRLHLSSAASARMVNGITVAVAGAIAVQMLFAGAESDFTKTTGQDPERAQASVSKEVRNGQEARDIFERFRTTPGVRGVQGIIESQGAKDGAKPDQDGYLPTVPVTVGDCATLRELVAVDRCTAGSVFLVQAPDSGTDVFSFARPGGRLNINTAQDDEGRYTGKPALWTLPRTAQKAEAKKDAAGTLRYGIFTTPETLKVTRLAEPRAYVLLQVDPRHPDAMERVRNTTADIDPTVDVLTLQATEQSQKFVNIRRGLFIGATAVLVLIGASLLVTMLEQLRERKRLLAALVAFGTRRSTLSWSVLWQTAVPVALGLGLAMVGGVGLGAVLLKMVNEPVVVDWSSVGAMTAIGGAVVLLVTALSLPPLWRMMRPDGLHTE